MASSTVTVESETLEAFLPDLMTAICDDVQRITDQCLASGIISDSRRRRILEAKGSEDQTRALIQCVQNSTKTDSRCFEIFLDCLDKELPRLVKEKLLPDMRRDLAERASIRKAVVPAAGFPKLQEDDHMLCLQQQRSLFGRYENSMKKYAHASAEKGLCEQSLQSKTQESGQLRSTLEMLRNQSSAASYSQEIDSTVERLSACEMEMAALKERIEKLESIVQEEDMQARRGKNIIMVGTKTFARMTEEQFAAALREKDEECKRLLKEREDELRRRMEEEMDIREKDLKHQVEIQQTQLQMKELELRNVRMRQEMRSNLNPFPRTNARTHRVVSHSLRHYFRPSPTTSRPQFAVLLKELHQVHDDWENIGILLNIEDQKLMAIRRDNYDSKACLREMLKVWLRRVDPRPSWQAVIDALHALGHERIANHLKSNYLL